MLIRLIRFIRWSSHPQNWLRPAVLPALVLAALERGGRVLCAKPKAE